MQTTELVRPFKKSGLMVGSSILPLSDAFPSIPPHVMPAGFFHGHESTGAVSRVSQTIDRIVGDHQRNLESLLDRSLQRAMTRAVGRFDEALDTALVQYARRKLNELKSGEWDDDEVPSVNPTASNRLLRILAHVSHEETVYPALVPDLEGGVVAEWRAGLQHLVLEVDSEGTAFISRVGENGGEEASVDLNFDQDLYRHLRAFDDELVQLSRRVAKVNPDWRALFN